jgi:hypothetical protein
MLYSFASLNSIDANQAPAYALPRPFVAVVNADLDQTVYYADADASLK